MIRLILILGISWTFTSLSAQNSWFIPFGQTSDEVRRFLETKDYLKGIQEDKDLQRMLAIILDDKQVEYVFKDDKLYAISLSKYFGDKAEARLREQSCIKYLDIIGNGQVTKTDEDRRTCYTVVTGNRFIKFFVIPQGEGHVLQITALSRLFGDMNSKDQFMYELKILQEKMTN